MKLIFFCLIFLSSNLFSVSCQTLAENTIPCIRFTFVMQHEFRKLLQQHKLLEFDDFSQFSFNFMGTMVAQKTIDHAVSYAFEKFALNFVKNEERNRRNVELKNIEKITEQEQKIKALLLQAVRNNQNKS